MSGTGLRGSTAFDREVAHDASWKWELEAKFRDILFEYKAICCFNLFYVFFFPGYEDHLSKWFIF
jgi:hypothetical protein